MQRDLELRREARARGLRWGDVLEAYAEVKHLERVRREHANAVREHAWTLYTATTPYRWPFWRVGFQTFFGKRIARGADLTSIPGYDTLASEVALTFPEYAGPDGTERLWAFLLSPYDPLPSRESMIRAAMDRLEAHRSEHEAGVPADLEVPF